VEGAGGYGGADALALNDDADSNDGDAEDDPTRPAAGEVD